jgi:sugar phosphate isomerase/epimerase
MKTNRRTFLSDTLKTASLALAASAALPRLRAAERKLPFMISLAEWSLHRTLFANKLDHLDFPRVARQDYGIEAIELVNQFFKDKARDQAYLGEFKKRADGLGVKILLIMVDGEGALGQPDAAKRQQAVENHYKWVEAARYLNCHSIRVNAETGGVGTPEEQAERAADGLRQLALFAAKHGLNVLVENHGGLSSNGAWLAGVMKKVNLPNCGTLPDFGNFRIREGEEYDRYKGVAELMPFAKAVSAKSHDFDAEGNEIHTDYRRMMKIVLDAGYRGYVGIEYEGNRLSEPEGIRATKALLERIQKETSWA